MSEIGRLHRLYRSGARSPVAVAQEHLARATGLGAELNAFTQVLEAEALAAAEASARRYDAEQSLSPLDGIPVTIKDIIHVEGVPTTAGSQAGDPLPQPQDAEVVARLRALGAVILGKTNLLEYAMGLVHPTFGAVHNPWDLERTIGGSSSGSAAAVAIGAGLASIGTDTAGSVRNPAALAGVVGFKPSFGALPTDGTLPLSPTLDHLGILARSALDAQTVYEELIGARLQTRVPWPLRIGVASGLTVHEDVQTHCDAVVRRLSQAGHRTQEVSGFPFGAANAAALTILYAEAAEVHAEHLRAHREGYAAATRARILAGRVVEGRDYARALAVKESVAQAFSELAARCDVIILPSLPAPAPREDGGGGDRSLSAAPLHTSVFNLLGVPAVSVPIGRSRETGMPVGLQIAGARGREGTVLRLAREVELLRGTWRTPWTH